VATLTVMDLERIRREALARADQLIAAQRVEPALAQLELAARRPRGTVHRLRQGGGVRAPRCHLRTRLPLGPPPGQRPRDRHPGHLSHPWRPVPRGGHARVGAPRVHRVERDDCRRNQGLCALVKMPTAPPSAGCRGGSPTQTTAAARIRRRREPDVMTRDVGGAGVANRRGLPSLTVRQPRAQDLETRDPRRR
jgi:hypothetical protein